MRTESVTQRSVRISDDRETLIKRETSQLRRIRELKVSTVRNQAGLTGIVNPAQHMMLEVAHKIDGRPAHQRVKFP